MLSQMLVKMNLHVFIIMGSKSQNHCITPPLKGSTLNGKNLFLFAFPVHRASSEKGSILLISVNAIHVQQRHPSECSCFDKGYTVYLI